jgi:hypothetical protein
MAQLDSDTDFEEDDNEIDYQHTWHRPAKRQDHAAKSAKIVIPSTKSSSKRPSTSRGISDRQIASISESSSPSSTFTPRRRHTRAVSGPEPATNKLHIDTILPLQLPPPNLCALSPLSTYPTTWWSTSKEDSLRRSDSTNSFISASSDGSWHGDHGDEDISGQLERAINQMSIPSTTSLSKKKTDDGLIISTYDYEDDDDFTHEQSPVLYTEIDIDDTKAKEIQSHAGPLMNEVASFFLDLKSSALSDYYYSNSASSSSGPSSLQQRVLNRSQSDRALLGSVSSAQDLAIESNMLHHHRRQRAATVPARSARALEKSPASTSRMQSLWQWFLPTIDDTLERELLGCPRHHHELRPRLDSIPSLYADSSDTEREESEDEDDDGLFTPGPLQDHQMMEFDSLKGRRSSISKTYSKRDSLSILDTHGAPSPLWDNRLEEEPYRRPWSSVLNLSALS